MHFQKANVSQYNNSRRQNVLWFEPAVPTSSTRPNQPIRQVFDRKLTDENDLNILNKSSLVDLTTNSPTFDGSLYIDISFITFDLLVFR